jgi:MFS transporter, FHS family, L-fucose permease
MQLPLIPFNGLLSYLLVPGRHSVSCFRVYLAVAGLGVVLNILFYFCDLPEITEDIGEDAYNEPAKPFHKCYRTIFGFVAQMAYVGAQVGVASL